MWNGKDVVPTLSQEGRMRDYLIAEAFKFLSGSLEAFLLWRLKKTGGIRDEEDSVRGCVVRDVNCER